MFRAACVALISVAGLACSGDTRERQFPTAPPPVVSLPPPPAPPPPPPGARRIAIGDVIVEELFLVPGPAGCPGTRPDNIDNIPLPCRHFEVVVPADGVLRIEVKWRRSYPDGGPWLIFAGVENTPHSVSELQVANHRVSAGATYGITVAWSPSHLDYNWGDGRALGEFSMTTKME
jgi:hypothetical protein